VQEGATFSKGDFLLVYTGDVIKMNEAERLRGRKEYIRRSIMDVSRGCIIMMQNRVVISCGK